VRAGRAAEAERHFVAAAQEDDTWRVRLADYYVGMGRRTDALKVLSGLVSETDSVDRRIRAVAQLRIAWLRHASGDRRGAHETVATALNDPAVAANAHLLKSRFLLEAGNLDEAFTHAREAARLQPAAAEPRFVLGQVHVARGELADAEKELERARARAPEAGRIELELAQVRAELHIVAGDLDAAIAEYERIARIEEKPAAALTAIGMLKAQLGDQAGARAAYVRALQLDPAAGIAANNLAWIYAQQGLLNDALRLASVAQGVLANAAPALDTSGWVHYLKGAAHLAIDPLERAVQAEPNEALYRYHLGAALLKTGQRQRAEREFRTALELSSDFEGAAEARQMLAKLHAVVD